MSKTLAAWILHPVWRIERDAVRRPVVIAATALVAVLRVIGLALIPITCVLWFALAMIAALREMVEDFPRLFMGTMAGECRAWAEMRRGVPIVWATSYDRRYVPTIMRRDDVGA